MQLAGVGAPTLVQVAVPVAALLPAVIVKSVPLVVVFTAATVMMVIAAVASAFDGGGTDVAGGSTEAAGERLGEEPYDEDRDLSNEADAQSGARA